MYSAKLFSMNNYQSDLPQPPHYGPIIHPSIEKTFLPVCSYAVAKSGIIHYQKRNAKARRVVIDHCRRSSVMLGYHTRKERCHSVKAQAWPWKTGLFAPRVVLNCWPCWPVPTTPPGAAGLRAPPGTPLAIPLEGAPATPPD